MFGQKRGTGWVCARSALHHLPPLLHQLSNVVMQPVSMLCRGLDLRSPRNKLPAMADAGITLELKGMHHLPLRTGLK